MKAMTKIFAFVFFLSLCLELPAQIAESTNFKERRSEACQCLQAMNEGGVAIVRLTSNSRKIEQLESMKRSKKVSKKKKKKYAQQIKEIKAETRAENELVMEAFTTKYDFSEVLFMYDYSFHELSAGKQNGYFLNRALEMDSTIDLADRYYRVIRYGFPNGSGQKRTKGLVVTDENNVDMLPPFPYKSFQPNMREAIGQKEEEMNRLLHIQELVDYLNRDFRQYLAKCKFKGWMTAEN